MTLGAAYAVLRMTRTSSCRFHFVASCSHESVRRLRWLYVEDEEREVSRVSLRRDNWMDKFIRRCVCAVQCRSICVNWMRPKVDKKKRAIKHYTGAYRRRCGNRKLYLYSQSECYGADGFLLRFPAGMTDPRSRLGLANPQTPSSIYCVWIHIYTFTHPYAHVSVTDNVITKLHLRKESKMQLNLIGTRKI